MNNKKLVTVLSIVLALVLIAGVSAYAAGNGFGTSSDPLVTLSYIEKNLTPSIMEKFNQELDNAIKNLGGNSGSSASDSFVAVNLINGQKLTGGTGCEIIPRSGTVTALGRLVDSTSGSTAESGATLSANHLYLGTAQSCGVMAGSSVLLLVRGSYTIS